MSLLQRLFGSKPVQPQFNQQIVMEEYNGILHSIQAINNQQGYYGGSLQLKYREGLYHEVDALVARLNGAGLRASRFMDITLEGIKVYINW